jgi:dTDP-glucose pyrophosphorylase
VTNPEKYGIFRTSGVGKIEEIVEKPSEPIGNLASVLYFKVNSSVVEDAKNIILSPRGEYELIAPINHFAQKYDFHVIPLQYPFLDITTIEDLE